MSHVVQHDLNERSLTQTHIASLFAGSAKLTLCHRSALALLSDLIPEQQPQLSEWVWHPSAVEVTWLIDDDLVTFHYFLDDHKAARPTCSGGEHQWLCPQGVKTMKKWCLGYSNLCNPPHNGTLAVCPALCTCLWLSIHIIVQDGIAPNCHDFQVYCCIVLHLSHSMWRCKGRPMSEPRGADVSEPEWEVNTVMCTAIANYHITSLPPDTTVGTTWKSPAKFGKRTQGWDTV